LRHAGTGEELSKQARRLGKWQARGLTAPTCGWRMRSFRADAPSKKRPHRNGDPHVVLVNTLVWKILVTRVNRKISRVEYGGNNRAAFGTALNNPKTRLREQDKHLFIQKDFPARGNRTRATGLSLGEKLPQEKKMRTVAIILGAAAAIAVAAPASADPAAGRVQLAQAQDAQSGSGMGASQQGSSGNRNSGAAATRNSQGGGAASRESNGGRTTMRGETQGSSRTTVRARSGGDRMAVHGRGHTTVGMRSAASDDAVIIKRKKARRYVYGEPSTTIVKKRRYTRYHEPSSAVIVKKRHAGVAVDNGVSTRTSVRSRTSTAGGGSKTTRTGASASQRSGQGNAGAASSTEGRAPGGARSGGANSGRSAPSGGGAKSGGANQSPSGPQ